MKRLSTFGIVSAIGLAAICATATPANQGPAIEAPTVLKEAMASVTVSDLHGLLDGIGVVSAQVSPMMNGAMLKTLLGTQLGDPQLAGILPGKGLAIVALDQTCIFAVAEVADAQMAAYTNQLARIGLLSSCTNGLLTVAKDATQLERGVACAQAVAGQLLARRSPVLRIALRPAECLARNDQQIQRMLAMLPMMVGMQQMKAGASPETMQSTAKLMETEVRVLLSLAGQVDALEIALSPENGSILLTDVLDPRPDSRLAKLLGAPAVNDFNPALSSGLLPSGAFDIEGCFRHPAALCDFVAGEAEELSKRMGATNVQVRACVDLARRWLDAMGGTICENIVVGTNSQMRAAYLIDIKDEAAALALLRSAPDELRKSGLLDFYKTLGMPMSLAFNEKVREYKGVPIHRFAVTMDLGQMPADARKEFSAMFGDMGMDVALHKGTMAYTLGDGIEEVIDRLLAPSAPSVPLAARAAFPAGGVAYIDMDVARYMAFAAGIMPDDPAAQQPLRQIADMLKGAPPITGASYANNGRKKWMVRVPAELIARIGQAAMMMQMQQMQAVPQAPAPTL